MICITPSKLSKCKTETHSEIRYDNQPLVLKIHDKSIKYACANKFDESKMNFFFRDDVLSVFDSIDNFMTSKMKDPTKYNPLKKRFISFKTDSQDDKKPIDFILLSLGKIWTFKGEIGLQVHADVTNKDKPTQTTRDDVDNFFVD